MINDVGTEKAGRKGKGVFAKASFKAGKFIFQAKRGKIITTRSAKRLKGSDRKYLDEAGKYRWEIMQPQYHPPRQKLLCVTINQKGRGAYCRISRKCPRRTTMALLLREQGMQKVPRERFLLYVAVGTAAIPSAHVAVYTARIPKAAQTKT